MCWLRIVKDLKAAPGSAWRIFYHDVEFGSLRIVAVWLIQQVISNEPLGSLKNERFNWANWSVGWHAKQQANKKRSCGVHRDPATGWHVIRTTNGRHGLTDEVKAQLWPTLDWRLLAAGILKDPFILMGSFTASIGMDSSWSSNKFDWVLLNIYSISFDWKWSKWPWPIRLSGS